MVFTTMEFFLTQKGNDALLYQGYEYTKYRENGNGVISWRCRSYFGTKCRAFLRTKDENVIGEVPQHCHDSNPQKAQANILKCRMKLNMKEVGATPKIVIGDILSEVNTDILEHLPKLSSLSRNLLKHKEPAHVPSNDTDCIIPKMFAEMILYDSGADDPERILAIGNEELFSESNKDVIYGDGTFDKSPSLLYQLYTWHAKIGNSYPPFIYFLLQEKNIDIYNKMFAILKHLIPDIKPQTIFLDFDKPCMSAAQVAFPEAQVKGYYSHLCQSLIKKINSTGLKERYASDIDTKLVLKSLPVLSFVPISDVKSIFDQLVTIFPDEDSYNEILAYFHSTYIEGVAGRSPIFPISIWNHFESAAEGSINTTNCCEQFHNVLNSLFQSNHPNFCNLLDGLRRDISCHRSLLANVQTGRLEVKKRKKSETISNQVAIIVQDYENQVDKLRFLRRLANLL